MWVTSFGTDSLLFSRIAAFGVNSFCSSNFRTASIPQIRFWVGVVRGCCFCVAW
jgi:hypothetical protein